MCCTPCLAKTPDEYFSACSPHQTWHHKILIGVDYAIYSLLSVTCAVPVTFTTNEDSVGKQSAASPASTFRLDISADFTGGE